MISRVQSYISAALAELHQVRWPTRQQAVRLSVIVIAFVLVNAIVFGVVDYVLAQLISLLLSLTY